VGEVYSLVPELTNYDKVKYLKRYILLDREIDRKVQEIARWRGMLGKVTAVYTSEPKGGGSIYGKTEGIVAKIVDLEQEVNREIDDQISIREDIKDIIAAVENDRERMLLEYRYLDGKTFEWIAGEMEFSWRHIHRLHSRALLNLSMSLYVTF
jgi:DNA-directed RNA polymerase specialized sigma subunit